MKLKYLLYLGIFYFATNANSQAIKTKLDVVGGISAREYIHGGLRYQYSDITQLGFYIGNDLNIRDNEDITTYSLDHMIHFGKLSSYTNRPVWYGRQGYTYSVNKISSYEKIKFSYLNFSAGREFGINDWLGVNADLGFIWQFRKYTENTNIPLETPINTTWHIYPLARIQLFVSF